MSVISGVLCSFDSGLSIFLKVGTLRA